MQKLKIKIIGHETETNDKTVYTVKIKDGITNSVKITN